ncbi:MAG: hypothetical protein QXW40_06155 [Thermofilum sp.]
MRPRKLLLRKLSLLVESLTLVPTSIRGLDVSLNENIPLGDGF